MSLITLSPQEGFSLDGRAPRWDPIAVSFTNEYFGKANTTAILEKYRRSHVSLDALKEDIFQYDHKYAPRLRDDPVYIAALQSVREQFVPQVPITPLTMGAVTVRPRTPKDKSPGLPWRDKGYRTKQDVWDDPEAMALIRSEWMIIGRTYLHTLPDCLTFCRAQICGIDDNKLRATWGYPTSVFTEEARFVYPYLDFLKKRKDDYPLAYGIEMGNGGMGYINDMFRQCTSPHVGMLDWKRFDKTIPAWLIRDAFNILRECFEFTRVVASDGIEYAVNPEITANRWKKMVNYFINTPFRLPTGERYKKTGGVPSGSCWTNIVDSIVNAIVTRYVVYHTTGRFPHYDIYMGDDSVIMTPAVLNLDDMATLAFESFGMVINTAKSYVTTNPDNIQFLGYYNRSGTPWRSQDFLVASFLLPEHVNEPDPTFTAARAVGQMYSTFNGISAQIWLEMVKGIETEYKLPNNWFVDYISAHPNRLKFLRLHGLEALDFPQPERFSALVAPMNPPQMPSRRRPVQRLIDAQILYKRFTDDPLFEAEYDE